MFVVFEDFAAVLVTQTGSLNRAVLAVSPVFFSISGPAEANG